MMNVEAIRARVEQCQMEGINLEFHQTDAEDLSIEYLKPLAELFAHAREDIPALLSELDAVKAERDHYKQLESDGRLIELPCKVGDTVYRYNESWRTFKGVHPFKITNLIISQNKKGVWTKKYRAMLFVNGKTQDSQINFEFDDIGKTEFLKSEEAELAAKELG